MEDSEKPKITGYRQLTDVELGAINDIKQLGVELGVLTEKLRTIEGVDQRWISIGVTDLQKGLMALTRAVARPTTF